MVKQWNFGQKSKFQPPKICSTKNTFGQWFLRPKSSSARLNESKILAMKIKIKNI